MALNDIQDIPNPGNEPNQLTNWKNWKKIRVQFQDAYYTSNYGNFATLLSDLGTRSVTVYANSAVAITANLTIPSNISLVVLKGGSFAISTGVTLTIQGPFSAGLFQVFSGLGTVSLSAATSRAFSQWWGAAANGSTDCLSAIHKALAAHSHVYLPDVGLYRTSAVIVVPGGKHLFGDSKGSKRGGSTIYKERGNYTSFMQTDSTVEDYGGGSVSNLTCRGGWSSIWTDVQDRWATNIHLPMFRVENVLCEPDSSTATTGTAQAGAAGTITLASGASAVAGAYDKMVISLTGGTGAGQIVGISAYNSATKEAAVYPAFSPAPDDTTTYSILNTGYMGNGFRFHDDNHATNGGSMGCWLSSMTDCRFVGVVGLVPTNQGANNLHIGIDMSINGGAVRVANTTIVRTDVGAWVRQGENITFDQVDLEIMPGGTTSAKVHASLIIGEPGTYRGIKGFSYTGYIEVCGRAILIQNTRGCKIYSSYINPTRGWDKTGTPDALIYLKNTATGVSIENNDFEVNFTAMSIVHSDGPRFSSFNNKLFRNITNSVGVPQSGLGANGVYSIGTQPVRINDLAIALDGSNVHTDITNVTSSAGLIKITSTSHGRSTGNQVWIANIAGTVGAACNGQLWTVTVIDVDNFTLNGSTFSGAYTSGGQVFTDGNKTFSPITGAVANGTEIKLTCVAHGKLSDTWVWIEGIVGSIQDQSCLQTWQIAVDDADHFTLRGSKFVGSYTSGGKAWYPETKVWTDYEDYVSGLTSNLVPKWNGTKFVNGSITDDGTYYRLGTGRIIRTVDNDQLWIKGGLDNDLGAGLFLNGGTPTGVEGDFKFRSIGNDVLSYDASASLFTIIRAISFALSTSVGTQLGTAANQLLALWGATPAAQPSGAAQAAVAAQTQDALTDSTTGTADTTVADVGAAFSQATLNNNFADILAQLAKIRTDIAAIKTFQDKNRTDQVAVGIIKGSA